MTLPLGSALLVRRSRPRTRRVALGLAGAAVVASMLLSASAEAHNYLVSSTPAEGATVTELPEAFSVTTNEDMLDLGGQGSGFALQVTDAQGLYYGDGCVTVAGATMSTPVAFGTAGPYTLSWQAVSIDGHTVSGDLSFTWAPTAAYDGPAGSVTPPVCGIPTTPVSSASPDATSPSPDTPASPDASASPDAGASGGSASSSGAAGAPEGAASAPLLVGGSLLTATAVVAGAVVVSRRRRPGR